MSKRSFKKEVYEKLFLFEERYYASGDNDPKMVLKLLKELSDGI